MLFENIYLLVDPVPRAAAVAMAIDEVLLMRTELPILRVYGWSHPSVSIGYFEEWESVSAAYPQHDLVRRWTGGGIVPHGEDWTYSLIVPKKEPLASLQSGESYRLLHEVLAAAFRSAGLKTDLTPEAKAKISQACFENPAQHDVLVAGQKIAGAAQRRSRFGLLHQGSVQGVRVPECFENTFAGMIAKTVLRRELLAEEEEEAHKLASTKYSTDLWNRKY